MANEVRLIDANAVMEKLSRMIEYCKTDSKVNGLTALFQVGDAVMDCPTVDAVEVADMREFAEDVAYQFGYYGQYNGRLHIGHGGLSTLEWAFDILGWDNPHPAPEFECEIEGCHEHATCETPTADGYKRMCHRHYSKHCARMEGDWNG